MSWSLSLGDTASWLSYMLPTSGALAKMKGPGSGVGQCMMRELPNRTRTSVLKRVILTTVTDLLGFLRPVNFSIRVYLAILQCN